MWSPVETAKFFWPIGDCINEVPLQQICKLTGNNNHLSMAI